ncbi:hypothetical protein [Anoxynatronum buryatiense]|uniref:Uncharacterized protein n=1 Tax=Anoxynatronum buryatiense TaxID=489973 RepID=A0AA45WVH4_9CLOT|nr:hypothetical protein [Anoxynatronum buryatiense]SMP53859.1 hypothetical protein SAMN06296020_10564 [Anoxynatronum buryatiense]
MTHSLHRKGEPSDLNRDFVVLSMAAQGFNNVQSADKLREIFNIIVKYEPVNYGEVFSGPIFRSSNEEMLKNMKDNSYIHFVFDEQEKVAGFLRELKEADYAMSVVVSGVVEEVKKACEKAGLNMHTVNFSGGILGNTGRLPEASVLEITTMCGHGLISANLVKQMVLDLKKGRGDYREYAIDLAKQCQCGIFNPDRAEKILRRMVDDQ